MLLKVLTVRQFMPADVPFSMEHPATQAMQATHLLVLKMNAFFTMLRSF